MEIDPMTEINTDMDPINAAFAAGSTSGDARQAFLHELSVSGDIQLAAEAAGHSDDAAFFQLRQTDVAFAAQWDAASDVAYLRLESALLAGALRAAKDTAAQSATASDLRVAVMWHRLSLSLLSAHRLIRGKAKASPVNIASGAREMLLAKLDLMRSRTENRSANMALTE
jgi:hypothetical protein